MRFYASFLVGFILLITTAFSQDGKKYPLKISVKVLKKENYTPSNAISLTITITNTSDTSFSFFMKTCSWHDNIVFSPNVIFRNHKGCDINPGKIIELGTKKSVFYSDEFLIADSLKSKTVKIKAALKLKSDKNKPFDFSEITEQSILAFEEWQSKLIYDYIWSKPIFIKLN